MTLTEEEAREKWCPHARELEVFNNKASYNRSLTSEDWACCIASECMAWRWNWAQKDIDYGSGERPTEGFCGLASRPG